MWDQKMVEELFFEILFVMTEVVGGPSTMAFQKTLFLFWIDLGQVLRVMCLPVYGWSHQSYDLMKNLDLVYVLATFVSKVIPRYSLFILAQFLVLLALGDAFYAAKLFKSGSKVNTMWPIKLLRFLVGSVVTILFSSVLKWLIIPIDCQVSAEKSLSSYFHGDDAPCTPWATPELVFSLVSVLSAAAYISFAVVVSLLSFETNALARGVRASSTGRVEAWWIVAKVAVTFMAYTVQWLQAASCAVVILLLLLWVLYNHITLLPFHRHETNLIRGGVFFFVVWLALATVIVSAADVSQMQEWALLAIAPVFFVLGVCFTHWIRSGHDRSIERLRAEYLRIQSYEGGKGSAAGKEGKEKGEVSPELEMDDQGSFSRFYDPTWESRKAFTSPASAKVMLRTLLYRRERQDVAFLLYAMDRAIQEYPNSIDLRIFELLLVRFIKQDHMEAAMLEKRYKSEKQKLAVDYRYVLFALDRKALKESAGAHLGKGKFSVINVMEFDAGMERSRKAHTQCIIALRKFWSSTKHMKNAERRTLMMEEMLTQLHSVNSAIAYAAKEYASLVELYPASVTLLHTYAHFCETILNDRIEAGKWRAKAEALEEMSDDDSTGVDDGEETAPSGIKKEQTRLLEDENDGGKSSVSGVSASGKTLLERNLIAWRDSLLKDEMGAMTQLRRRVKIGVLLMLTTATAGYFVMNHILLSDMAVDNINSIDSTLSFAGYSIMTMYLMRNQELAARQFDTSRIARDKETMTTHLNMLKDFHHHNFETLPSSDLVDFYLDEHMPFEEPFISGWKNKVFSFWDGMNVWVTRSKRAIQATPEELRSESMVLAEISDSKRNIAFVMENTIPVVLPAFEEVLNLYQREVIKFVSLADTLVYITVGLDLALVIAISSFVIWMVRTVVPLLQCKRTCVFVALRFPRKCQSKLRSFYQDLEHKMELLEEGLQMTAEGEEFDLECAEGRPTEDGHEPPRGMLRLGTGGELPVHLPYNSLVPAPVGDREDLLLPYPRRDPLAREPPRMKDLVGQVQQGSLLTASVIQQHIMATSGGDQQDSPIQRGSFRQQGSVRGERAFKESLRALILQRGPPIQEFSSRSPHPNQPVSPRHGRSPLRISAEVSGDSKLAKTNQASDDFVLRAIYGFRLDKARSFRGSQGDLGSSFVRRSGQGSFRAPRSPRAGSRSPTRGGRSPRSRSPLRSPLRLPLRSPLRSPTLGSPVGSRRPSGGMLGSPVGDKLTYNNTTEDRMAKTSCWLEDNTGLYRTSPPSSPKSGLAGAAATARKLKRPLKLQSQIEQPDEVDGTRAVPEFVVPPPRRRRNLVASKLSSALETPDDELVAARAEQDEEGDKDEGGKKDEEAEKKDEDGETQQEVGGVSGDGEEGGDGPAEAAHTHRAEGEEEVTHAAEPEEPAEGGGVSGTGGRSIIKYDATAAVQTAPEDMPMDQLPPEEEEGTPLVVIKQRDMQDQSLRLTELGDALTNELDSMMVKHRHWHSRAITWVAAMIIMGGFSVFTTMYPMRVLPDIKDMAPITDHGGRRAYIMQECVFLTRELILDDGYSRMHATELAQRLDGSLKRLRREHTAVRLGGDQGIVKGADVRFASHNKVMYDPGCMWREGSAHRRSTSESEEEAGGECDIGDGVNPDATRNGLDYLFKTFVDSAEGLLDKWGPPGWREAEDVVGAAEHRRDLQEEEFSWLNTRPERLADVEKDMHFLEMAFYGDLVEGLGYVQNLFHRETQHILELAHREVEVLFILYVLAIVCLWYGVLFHSVSKSADRELLRARDFVSRLPLQVMTTKEMNCIGTIFLDSELRDGAEH